jgi:hypothetical protein
MSKLINFVDENRILNGYVNGVSTEVNTLKDIIKPLKEGKETHDSIQSVKIFTNRFAYSFLLKENKIIASKQCENCAIVNGKPMRPSIVDETNPYFLVSKNKCKKLFYKDVERFNKSIKSKHKNFDEVKEADEFVYDTVNNEYIVVNAPVIKTTKQNPNKEGFYVVYADEDQLRMKFGDTRSIDQNLIKYRGYDTFKDANARYKQFIKDVQ